MHFTQNVSSYPIELVLIASILYGSAAAIIMLGEDKGIVQVAESYNLHELTGQSPLRLCVKMFSYDVVITSLAAPV